MYCPSCGKSIAEGSTFCMHCGKPVQTMAKKTATPTALTSAPSVPICTNCGMVDAVRKASSIVQGETSTMNYEVTVPAEWQGKTYYLPANRSTMVKSVLAQKLTPTPQPSAPNGCWAVAGAAFMVYVVLCVAGLVLTGLQAIGGAISQVTFLAYPIIIFIIVIIIVVPVFTFIKVFKFLRSSSQIKYSTAMSGWKEEQELYNKLFYCYRCDGLFVSDDTKFMPMSEV